MTNEERDIIAKFIGRVGGAAQPQAGVPGSVLATAPQALPPVDRDADGFIADQFNRYPDARYRITQLAFVQEHALAEAQNRITRLEWELQQAQQAVQQAQQQAQAGGARGGGFFGGLFGGGGRSGPSPQGGPAWGGGPQQGYQQGYPQQGYQAAPPPPQYAPGYQPGMFQRPGSGFLGSALTTAAGVAGGVVVGNALMNMFSPHSGVGGLAAPAAPALSDSPWATPAASPSEGAVDQGAWGSPDPGAAAPDPGYVDNGAWDTSGGGDTSWTDTGGDGGGGWDTGGGGGGFDDTI
jgi:hypothetical protein